jgi:outer membrane protein assembly factor BamE
MIPRPQMSKLSLFLSLSASLLVTSCSYVLNNLPGVYTVDVQQGNIVDQAMVDQLRPNMNKRQVLFIMGSPMLSDVFHQNQWNYLYSNQPGGDARKQKKITLFFKDDKVVGIQGDFRPSSLPVIKASDEKTVDVPKRDLDETLWDMMVGLFGFDDIESADDSAEANKKNETKLKSETDKALEKESTHEAGKEDVLPAENSPKP